MRFGRDEGPSRRFVLHFFIGYFVVMMKALTNAVKILLHNVLGTRHYLSILSKTFLVLYAMGKKGGAWDELHALRPFIQPGDVCLDIGANLGYYTIPMAKYAGRTGKIIAVEPVHLFASIIRSNATLFGARNVEIFQFALGREDGTMVEMGTPVVDGVFHHGYTKIKSPNDAQYEASYSVRMRHPMALFGEMERLDFVKCDVEGYELNILLPMEPLFKRFFPAILVECVTTEDRMKLHTFFRSLGYTAGKFQGQRFRSLKDEEMPTLPFSNFLYLHPSRSYPT